MLFSKTSVLEKKENEVFVMVSRDRLKFQGVFPELLRFKMKDGRVYEPTAIFCDDEDGYDFYISIKSAAHDRRAVLGFTSIRDDTCKVFTRIKVNRFTGRRVLNRDANFYIIRNGDEYRLRMSSYILGEVRAKFKASISYKISLKSNSLFHRVITFEEV